MQPADTDNTTESGETAEQIERQNVVTLVLHQICIRTGWIFKTESVIMPAFLDTISQAGWVQGMLPPLNRFGQSLAPLILSERLSKAPLKSHWLATSTMLMGLPFLCLGGILLLTAKPTTSLVIFFLASYLLFFCVTGVNQASFNTIQGKLIRPARRGRLVAIAGYVGSPVAVTLAWFLLRPWTDADPPKYAWIFLFTGTVFLAAGFTVRRLKEKPDAAVDKPPLRVKRRFQEARAVLTADRNLRRLCVLAALFVCSQLLFPHYQRLGHALSGFEGGMLMYWVVAQNLSAAFFSWISGRLADRNGTRSALRFLTFVGMFPPALSLLLEQYAGASCYWLTFVVLGAVPVTYRMMLNYALELTHRANHPIYVSTVVLCMAPPIVLSPLIGEFVARIGYTTPFLSISALLVVAWGMTISMVEPRKQLAT